MSAVGSAFIGSVADEAMGAWVQHQFETGAWPPTVYARHWKFYCPQDLGTFLSSKGGWRLTVAKDARQAAAEEGWNMVTPMDTKAWVDDEGRKPNYYWLVARK
jgi:hypothetical protein